MMKLKHAVALIAVIFTTYAGAKDTPSISARGHHISIGDTADSVFAALKKTDMISQEVLPDPSNPASLRVTKRYKVDGNSFVLVFTRAKDSGPYVVTHIDASETATPNRPGVTTAKTSGLIPTSKAFEASDFFKKYKPKKESWPLKNGETNTTYTVADPENPYSERSVSITDSPRGPKEISVLWYGMSESKPALMSKAKEDFVRDILHSASPTVKPEDVLKYMKSAGRKNYPDGSTTMPRTTIQGLHMFSGTAGSMFMVGLEQ